MPLIDGVANGYQYEAGVEFGMTDHKETVVLLTGRNVAPKLLSEVLHS